MIKEKMVKAFNDQINAELYSAYLYLAMSAECEAMNLSGAGNWFRIQAQEEVAHAMKFFGHINDRGGKVILQTIEQPNPEWKTLLDMFEASYTHEQYITSRINDLVDLAAAEKDHAAQPMLQWFVTEQIEEEMNADKIVQQLKLTSSSPQALLFIDQALGRRVFTPPAAPAT